MTQRDKKLASVIGIVAIVGGGLFGGLWFFRSLSAASREMEDLDAKIGESHAKIKKVRDDAPALQLWRRLSLTGDEKIAARSYRETLTELLRKHDVQELNFRDEQQKSKSSLMVPGFDPLTNKQSKVPLWTGINYQVNFKTKLANLVALVKEFQQLPMMHRVKTLTIERTDEKKEGELLTVVLSFEAIAILNADKIQDKAGFKDVSGLQKAEVADTLAGLRGAPAGFGLLGWLAGPKSVVIPPLNPPLTAMRKYGDIARKNIFMGFVQVSPIPAAGTDGPPPSDDVINTMRFARYVGLTNDDGKVEAWLWDASNSLEKKRIKKSGGFDRFTLLQTANFKPVVQGVVVSFEKSELVFRVALKASDPSSSKWWRYPTYNHFYNLHPDDFATLAAAGKVNEADKGNLYLVNDAYWEKLTKGARQQIEVYPDGTSFRFSSDFSHGDIVHSDRDVHIVRISSWPPGTTDKPSLGIERMYADDKTIYHVHKNHFADMLTDKTLASSKKLNADEIDRVYAVHTSYWDLLTHQKLLYPDTYKGSFTFYKKGFELVRGDIISRNDEMVVFRVAEKYCHCPGDDNGVKDYWHEGFCLLKMDNMVQDALLAPVSLSDTRLKEYLKPASATTAGQ